MLPNSTSAERPSGADALGEWPCGGATSGHPQADVVRVFHYGANMACARLALGKVTPVRAEAAYVPGHCLRFAAAEGVPTCSKETAFGTLEPCEVGCVHGVVHDIPASQLQWIHDSEPGYKFGELPGVTTYTGQVLIGVQAYTMQPDNVPFAFKALRRPGLLLGECKPLPGLHRPAALPARRAGPRQHQLRRRGFPAHEAAR